MVNMQHKNTIRKHNTNNTMLRYTTTKVHYKPHNTKHTILKPEFKQTQYKQHNTLTQTSCLNKNTTKHTLQTHNTTQHTIQNNTILKTQYKITHNTKQARY